MTHTNALLTDPYELTVMAGYLDQGKADDTATFDLYFRPHLSKPASLPHSRLFQEMF